MPRYRSGQPVTLATRIADAAGQLADPTSISLAVRAPDGTTTPYASPSHDGLGLYSQLLTAADLDQLGDYRYAWTSTGNVAGVDADSFKVVDAFADLVTVAEVRAHLRLRTTANDTQLATFLDAAYAATEQRVGQLTATTVTETLTASSGGILSLSRRPATAIVSLTPAGGTAYAAGAVELIGDQAIGTVGGAWPYRLAGLHTVVYTAGWDPLPADLRLGILDLVLHWWRQSQSHGSATYGDDQDAVLGADFSDLPNAVLNKIRPYGPGAVVA